MSLTRKDVASSLEEYDQKVRSAYYWFSRLLGRTGDPAEISELRKWVEDEKILDDDESVKAIQIILTIAMKASLANWWDGGQIYCYFDNHTLLMKMFDQEKDKNAFKKTEILKLLNKHQLATKENIHTVLEQGFFATRVYDALPRMVHRQKTLTQAMFDECQKIKPSL